MDFSNRSFGLLVMIALLMSVLAVVLTVTQGMDRSAPPPEQPADLLVVRPIIQSSGGQTLSTEGPVQVTVHRRTLSRTATLSCNLFKTERSIWGGQVEFPKIPDDGSCALRLQGTRRAHSPVFPGDELECRVIGEDTHCTGGAAETHSGTALIQADVEAGLWMDGEEAGTLPLEGPIDVRIGTRHIELRLEDGTRTQWRIRVDPGVHLDVFFPIREHRPDLPEFVPPTQVSAGAEG